MKFTKIELEDSMPTKVTVEMTTLELAQITKWLGGLNGYTTPEGLEGFYFQATRIFFNKFWDNGLNGCLDGDDE